MPNSSKIIFFVLVFFIFVLSGCSVEEKLDWLDGKLGEIIKDIESDEASQFSREVREAESEAPAQGNETRSPLFDFNNLTKEQKDKIDSWLEENGYNRYGDTLNTFYAGGTPLFDEKTGERVDRFDYILKKIPDILDKIK